VKSPPAFGGTQGRGSTPWKYRFYAFERKTKEEGPIFFAILFCMIMREEVGSTILGGGRFGMECQRRKMNFYYFVTGKKKKEKEKRKRKTKKKACLLFLPSLIFIFLFSCALFFVFLFYFLVVFNLRLGHNFNLCLGYSI
jgi:hypothetical protein